MKRIFAWLAARLRKHKPDSKDSDMTLLQKIKDDARKLYDKVEHNADLHHEVISLFERLVIAVENHIVGPLAPIVEGVTAAVISKADGDVQVVTPPKVAELAHAFDSFGRCVVHAGCDAVEPAAEPEVSPNGGPSTTQTPPTVSSSPPSEK